MNKAVFLDRDGVINKLVYNASTGEYESPHLEKDFKLYPLALKALKAFKGMGYLLFLVSNQPSYAKGKTSLENIKAIHKVFHKTVSDHDIEFAKYFYCYHHPDGIIEEYTRDCECRKPKPFFLLRAKEEYSLDMDNSWFIGDSDSDVFCGQAAGVKTILIEGERSKQKTRTSRPDFFADNLIGALKIIAKFEP